MASSSVPYDSLQVFWHNSEQRVICGKADRIKVYVHSEEARITFTTDQTVQGLGFQASWREIDSVVQAGNNLY